MSSMIPPSTVPTEPRNRTMRQSSDARASEAAYPELITSRFRFRPFRLKDIGQLAGVAGKHRIADTTVGVPHPFSNEFARLWISTHASEWACGRALHWAATTHGDDQIIGYAGLDKIDAERRQAELKFWVGSGVERFGYATEWSEAVVDFALTRIELDRVYALQLARHPLAGRVLSAVGMQQEGFLRKRIHNEGLLEDIVCWTISKQAWQSGRAARRRASIVNGARRLAAGATAAQVAPGG